MPDQKSLDAVLAHIDADIDGSLGLLRIETDLRKHLPIHPDRELRALSNERDRISKLQMQKD